MNKQNYTRKNLIIAFFNVPEEVVEEGQKPQTCFAGMDSIGFLMVLKRGASVPLSLGIGWAFLADAFVRMCAAALGFCFLLSFSVHHSVLWEGFTCRPSSWFISIYWRHDCDMKVRKVISCMIEKEKWFSGNAFCHNLGSIIIRTDWGGMNFDQMPQSLATEKAVTERYFL